MSSAKLTVVLEAQSSKTAGSYDVVERYRVSGRYYFVMRASARRNVRPYLGPAIQNIWRRILLRRRGVAHVVPLVPPCIAGAPCAARMVRQRAGDASCVGVLRRLCHGALQRAICCHSASRHRPNPDPSAQRYSIDFRSECKDTTRVRR